MAHSPMGFLHLMRHMSMERKPERRRRQARSRNGLITSRSKRKGSPCQQDNDSQDGETEAYSGPSLPEDILCHIHSLMPMRDAARAACVSRAFLRSWRFHPNLTFDDETFGLNKNACEKDIKDREFSKKVDHILKRHSGFGVKSLKLQILSDYNVKDPHCLNSWLQIVITPGIEELTFSLPPKAKYNFPYSFLCNGSGESIRYLHLACCSFHPTTELTWLRSLMTLHLHFVLITGDELESIFSNCFALERLDLHCCRGIVRLRLPCMLDRLSYLEVTDCYRLRVIDIKAPYLSSFRFLGYRKVCLSFGETFQIKHVDLHFSGAVFYSRVELPSSMPNLEALAIDSSTEIANTPMLLSKFLHLKNIFIGLNGLSFSPAYDYFSLGSFLEACPYLETFILDVSQRRMGQISIFTDSSDLRQMREQHHHHLKNMKILGFSSARSLVELACHVVESTTSLEHLTLEAHQSPVRCSLPGNKLGKCSQLPKDVLMEAHRGLKAIRTYVEPKVPSTVKLRVFEPCSCHDAVEFLDNEFTVADH